MTGTRVVHITQPTDYGVAGYVADLVAGQAERGWEVTVACPAEGALPAMVVDRGAQHVPWAATRHPGPTVAAEVAALRRLLSVTRPDVVHLHSSKAGLVGRAAIRGARPTIFQPHAWSFLTGPAPIRSAARRWERWASRWCDAIVCGSRGEQRRGVRAGIDGRWHVVPNAIDLRRFHFAGTAERGDARRGLGLGDIPLVVCVGRLCAQKAQDVLLEGWPAVRRRVRTAQLVLVGDGPDRAVIEQRRVSGVQLVGRQQDVRPWLWAADVVVQPSRYETMALSMLEAMASGRSVVATDIEGAKEAMGDGADEPAGALVRPGDAAGLAAALACRLERPDLAAAEGQAGRRRVAARHNLDTLTAGIDAVLNDVITRRQQSQPPTRS